MRVGAIVLAHLLCATATTGALDAQEPGAGCAHARADDRSTLVSVVVQDGLQHLGATVDTVLAELGYQMSVTESGIGQWVTAPRFAWPSGSEQAAWRGVDQPGVQVVVDLAPDSAGTRLSIATGAVCRVSPDLAAEQRSGSVESTIETVSAMQVATVLGRHLDEQRKRARP